MNARTALMLALAPAALADCSKPAPDAASTFGADAAEAPPDPSDAMPAEEPAADSSDLAEPAAAATIPLAAQGRRGLVPADCTSTRGDAKGLMTVDDHTIRFYELLATLKAVRSSSPTRIQAGFACEGEGMTWDRDLGLGVQDAGTALGLREYGNDAPPGARKYTRCA